ncbi:MAG: hypothetical protein WC551_05035 [Patescibacteria group bacterium]
MLHIFLTALMLGICLTAGNFLYQATSRKKDWLAAAERSFFQIIALILFAFFISLK